MSTTVATYPMVMALKVADRILGRDREWEAVNDTQVRFLKEYFEPCRKDRIPEIESMASWDAAEINSFLTQHRFPMEIGPFPADSFGAASVLDLLVEWIRPGSVTTIRALISKRQYPGAHITSGVAFLRAAGHREPIASMATKSGDQVLMTVLERPPEGFDLVAMAENLTARSHVIDDFEGLKFPMVHLDHAVDINWLAGLRTVALSGQPAWIAQALQQTRLRMNQTGARAESAVALVTEVTAALRPPKPKPPLVIDRPFLAWFKRQGLARPLFVGHISEGDWRNPGEITA
ncbi:MAG: hypothetical protein ACLQOO_13525 [Terriglobia bacterium]